MNAGTFDCGGLTTQNHSIIPPTHSAHPRSYSTIDKILPPTFLSPEGKFFERRPTQTNRLWSANNVIICGTYRIVNRVIVTGIYTETKIKCTWFDVNQCVFTPVKKYALYLFAVLGKMASIRLNLAFFSDGQ